MGISGAIYIGAIPEATVDLDVDSWLLPMRLHRPVLDGLETALLPEFETLEDVADVYGLQMELLGSRLCICRGRLRVVGVELSAIELVTEGDIQILIPSDTTSTLILQIVR